MKKLLILAALILSACGTTSTQPTATILQTLSGTINNESFTLTLTSQFAGAVASLNWDGFEFINTNDHGRELQSASAFDNLGECFNPTEAGSYNDMNGMTSTSQVLNSNNTDNELAVSTQMAFWLAPGQVDIPASCNTAGTDPTQTAVNTTVLSNHILNKSITIEGNTLHFRLSFVIGEPHTSGQFQVLIGYLNPALTTFYHYDPVARNLVEDTVIGQGTGIPILATANGLDAIALYWPDSSASIGISKGYSSTYLPANTSVVATFGNTLMIPVSGTYNFNIYVAVGMLQDVVDNIDSLYAEYGQY